jgi:hypothetical protein
VGQSIVGLASVLALCVPLACGSETPPAPSGVDQGKSMGQLSDAERGTLCDWTNDLLGGYAKTIDCGGGVTRGSDETQMQCTLRLSRLVSCPLNVGDYEICMRRLVALVCALDPVVPPECDVYFDCLGV